MEQNKPSSNLISILCPGTPTQECIDTVPNDVEMTTLDQVHLVTVSIIFYQYLSSKSGVSPKFRWNIGNLVAVMSHIISGSVEYTLGICALLIQQEQLIYIAHIQAISTIIHSLSTFQMIPNTQGDKQIAMTNQQCLGIVRIILAIVIIYQPYYRSAQQSCWGWLNLFMYLRVTQRWLCNTGQKGDRQILSMMMSLYCCMYNSYFLIYPMYIVGAIITAFKLSFDNGDDFSLKSRTLLNNDNQAITTLAENQRLLDMMRKLESTPALRKEQKFMDEFMYEQIRGDEEEVTLEKLISFLVEQGIYMTEIEGQLQKQGLNAKATDNHIPLSEFVKLRDAQSWTFELILMNSVEMLTVLLEDASDQASDVQVGSSVKEEKLHPILVDRQSRKISTKFDNIGESRKFQTELKGIIKEDDNEDD